MSHSKAPWTCKPSGPSQYEVFIVDDLPGRAVIATVEHQPNLPENARLIAAAPELLAALKKLRYDHGDLTAILEADAAIAKAEVPS